MAFVVGPPTRARATGVPTVASSVLLMQELRVLNSRINVQIEAIKKVAEKQAGLGDSKNVYDYRYADGKFVMPELLAAQAQVLNAQAILLAAKVK